MLWLSSKNHFFHNLSAVTYSVEGKRSLTTHHNTMRLNADYSVSESMEEYGQKEVGNPKYNLARKWDWLTLPRIILYSSNLSYKGLKLVVFKALSVFYCHSLPLSSRDVIIWKNCQTQVKIKCQKFPSVFCFCCICA